ncbi:MAG: metallophosphoesterase [Synechococcales bacterium]|nr:metallophosphoesterase [Synechococcales bacterium]
MHWFLTGPLTVERVTVPIADLPPALNRLKIVQMSDFHWDGLRLSRQLLQQAIAASNREYPDLILLTGDYVTRSPQPIHHLCQALQTLQSRYGIYAVLGNHDLVYGNSRREITQALETIGVQVLWNQVCYPLGVGLAIAGLAEKSSRQFQPQTVFSSIPTSTPRIVLAHNPDSAIALQPYRVDLQLSGHTHGGQILIPGMGPLPAWVAQQYRQLPSPIKHLFPRLRKLDGTLQNWQWHQGLHTVGQNQLYINRGLGTYLPGRFLCTPEVTVITLQQG